MILRFTDLFLTQKNIGNHNNFISLVAAPMNIVGTNYAANSASKFHVHISSKFSVILHQGQLLE